MQLNILQIIIFYLSPPYNKPALFLKIMIDDSTCLDG